MAQKIRYCEECFIRIGMLSCKECHTGLCNKCACRTYDNKPICKSCMVNHAEMEDLEEMTQ